MPLSRRTLFAATDAAGLPAFGVVRYGIPMTDIPQTTGRPDRGTGAYRFTGHALCHPLAAWEMDVADRLGKPRPPSAWRSRTPSRAASTRRR